MNHGRTKNQKNTTSVEAFLNRVDTLKQKEDSFVVLDLMKKTTTEKPDTWGPSIIGFGSYRYKYASGRENDWFLTGFSPRKQSLTLYSMNGFKNTR